MESSVDVEHSRDAWRWMILFSRFFWTFISLGNFKSMGVLIPHFMETLEINTASAGFVSTIIISLGGITAPFVGILLKVLDARKITMLGGTVAACSICAASFSASVAELAVWFALSSIGLSLIQVSTVKPLMDYFPDNFAAANGVSLVGGTVGIMALPPVMEYLVSLYGWRNALALMGAFSFNYVLCGALLRPLKRPNAQGYSPVPSQRDDVQSTPLAHRKRTNGAKRVGLSDKTDRENSSMGGLCRQFWQITSERFDVNLLTEGKFLIYQVVILLCGVVFGAWHVFVIPQGVELGYGDAPAAYLAIFGGIGSLIGRLGHGTLIDRGLIKAPSLFILSSLLFSASCLINPLAVSLYAALATLCMLAGVAIGVFYPLTFVLVRDVTGERYMSAIGWLYLFQSTGQIIGGILSGWIHDISGNYESVFMTLGGFAFIMAAILGLTRCLENFCCAED